MAEEQNQSTQAAGAPGAEAAKAEAAKAAEASRAAEAAKTTEAVKTAEATKTAEAAKASAVPEKYEFKAENGAELDADVIAEFSGAAKELGLSQEKASKVYGIGAKAIAKRDAQFKKAIDDTRAGWVKASQEDKEFGGEKLKENLALAAKARDAFGTPEFRKMLDETGLGDHPEMIRAFYRAGKAISGDRLVVGESKPKESSGFFSYPKSGHTS